MMMFLFLILTVYFATIGYLIYGFSKIKTVEAIGLKPKTKFTIIVPFRNEAQNLPHLLHCFSKQHYPMDLFEVILVDDDSTDGFRISSFSFPVSVIPNIRISNSPKKDAIVTALNRVTTDWIITTDADCVVSENWLLTFDNYIQQNKVSMIAGAVTYDCDNTFLQQFQQLDLASLQAATMGSFGIEKGFMCNGANFAYTKSFFNALNGFDGNDKIASGDDVFLLQKAMAKCPEKVHYLKSKNTIVTTNPLTDWKSLFYQRVRWASKTAAYQSNFGQFVAIIVFVANLGWIFSLGLGIFGLIPIENMILFLIIKFIVDTILIHKTNTFLGNKSHYLVLGSLIYPFFSVGVALYSLFGKYEWKGRQFK